MNLRTSGSFHIEDRPNPEISGQCGDGNSVKEYIDESAGDSAPFS
jgi:hypothetical protein